MAREGERGGKRWAFRDVWGQIHGEKEKLHLYTIIRRKAEKEAKMHMSALSPACKPVPLPCMAPGPF